MFFNSFEFLAFFIVVWLALFFSGRTGRQPAFSNALLLAASYFLYGSFRPEFLILLIYVTLVNYFGALLIAKCTDGKKRKRLVTLDVILSILPLFVYKYLGFIVGSFEAAFGMDPQSPSLQLLLPIGISFYTFQALTYTLDVYRGKIEARGNLLDIALFVAFFPTVLSGPIEKARHLLPQLRSVRRIGTTALFDGLTVFCWGLFKKMVIADRLAVYVDWAYDNAHYASGSTLALAALFYSIQIYCDFSGYSDMAIGIGRSLGFDISPNFRHPYFATTIKEFWKRWHISLTSWFTEYVYISCGGNRVSRAYWIRNISLVFLLSGIWHGAAWNFLAWGALHTIYYLVEHAAGLQQSPPRPSLIGRIIGWLYVVVSVTVAWIFFRIDDFSEAWYVTVKIFTDWQQPFSVGASMFSFVLLILLIFLFIAFDTVVKRGFVNGGLYPEKGTDPLSARNICWTVILILAVCLFGISSEGFVYFQF